MHLRLRDGRDDQAGEDHRNSDVEPAGDVDPPRGRVAARRTTEQPVAGARDQLDEALLTLGGENPMAEKGQGDGAAETA
jgi:hypothetical protein